MGAGDDYVDALEPKASSTCSAAWGEPMNPEAWVDHRVVGEERCPIVDTWWQTETGGILITPLPGATKLKPGSATFAFFSALKPATSSTAMAISQEGPAAGNLVILDAWPGIARTVYGDHKSLRRHLLFHLQGGSTSPATAAAATRTAITGSPAASTT